MKRIFITFFFLAFLIFNLSAQTTQETRMFSNIMSDNQDSAAYEKLALNNDNAMQEIVSGMFLFYKNFISSQDRPSCTFTPSCSEYAVTTIKSKGIFIGMLDTFDRLSRCNGLSPENYEWDKHTNKLKDPVE